MSFLIDTNIISELRKQHRCNANVTKWYDSVRAEDLFLSTLVLGEIRKGVEQCRLRDPAKASALEVWLDQVVTAFAGRVLSVDDAVAQEWGRMRAQRSVPVIDALMAATARVGGLTLVTRNISDVSGLGAAVLDPFVAV